MSDPYEGPLLKQDRQYTCNVTMRRVLATIVAVKKRYHIMCLWACVALVVQHTMRMRYCYLWPAPLCSITSHHKTYEFPGGGFFLNTKCVVWFPLQLLSHVFLILIKLERDIKNDLWSSCKVSIILVRF